MPKEKKKKETSGAASSQVVLENPVAGAPSEKLLSALLIEHAKTVSDVSGPSGAGVAVIDSEGSVDSGDTADTEEWDDSKIPEDKEGHLPIFYELAEQTPPPIIQGQKTVLRILYTAGKKSDGAFEKKYRTHMVSPDDRDGPAEQNISLLSYALVIPSFDYFQVILARTLLVPSELGVYLNFALLCPVYEAQNFEKFHLLTQHFAKEDSIGWHQLLTQTSGAHEGSTLLLRAALLGRVNWLREIAIYLSEEDLAATMDSPYEAVSSSLPSSMASTGGRHPVNALSVALQAASKSILEATCLQALSNSPKLGRMLESIAFLKSLGLKPLNQLRVTGCPKWLDTHTTKRLDRIDFLEERLGVLGRELAAVAFGKGVLEADSKKELKDMRKVLDQKSKELARVQAESQRVGQSLKEALSDRKKFEKEKSDFKAERDGLNKALQSLRGELARTQQELVASSSANEFFRREVEGTRHQVITLRKEILELKAQRVVSKEFPERAPGKTSLVVMGGAHSPMERMPDESRFAFARGKDETGLG